MTAPAPVRWLPRRPDPALRTTALRVGFDPTDFNPALKTRLLILQPTPFCNIDCDYCYLPERHSTARMSLATVRHAAERLLEDELVGEQLTVVWHAGEPLAMPVAWYDEAWCALIKRHQIRIGVSVDGPADLHDAHRRTRSGKGTHARVLQGMASLRAHGIDFHVIAVVTPATFAQADAFVDFFEAQGVRELGCNFDEAEGGHRASSLSGHEAAHAAFVARLLERTRLAGSTVRIRELALALQLIAEPLPMVEWQGEHWPENAQTLPFALISVAHNGDFSSFSPELLGQRSVEFGDFIFGNVATSGYFEAASNECFERVWGGVVRGTKACERSCSHFGFCGGGAPANKFYENGDLASAETLYCRTVVKRPFNAVLAQLERDRNAVVAHPISEPETQR